MKNRTLILACLLLSACSNQSNVITLHASNLDSKQCKAVKQELKNKYKDQGSVEGDCSNHRNTVQLKIERLKI